VWSGSGAPLHLGCAGFRHGPEEETPVPPERSARGRVGTRAIRDFSMCGRAGRDDPEKRWAKSERIATCRRGRTCRDSPSPSGDPDNNPCRRQGDQVVAATSAACRVLVKDRTSRSWCAGADGAPLRSCMDTSGQGVGAAFSRMQERERLRARAGIRSLLVRIEHPRRGLGDARLQSRKQEGSADGAA
jgi:hypothetical protein